MSILEYLEDNKALLSEYELMGYFDKAATLYVDLVLKKSPTMEHYFKAILLYELALDVETRNKIIRDLARFITKRKKMPEDIVPLVYTMMEEANAIDAKALKMPWPKERKIVIAKELEARGQGNKETRKLLTTTKETTGSLWAKFHLQKVEKLYNAQGKRTFYGRNSKRRFNRRLQALKKFQGEAAKVAEGADTLTRVILFEMAQRAYQNLGEQIEATPLPEGLDEASLVSVKENLTKMAAPFFSERDNYQQLKEEQLGKLDAEQSLEFVPRLASTQEKFDELIPNDTLPSKEAAKEFPINEYKDTIVRSWRSIPRTKSFCKMFRIFSKKTTRREWPPILQGESMTWKQNRRRNCEKN